MAVEPVPAGYHTVTPYLIVDDVAREIEFLKTAFGATDAELLKGPAGRVMHAELRIGTSMIMMGQASDTHAAQPSMLYLYVNDIDAVYRQAVQAGGESLMEPTDQFYGDRTAAVKDRCGNQWWIATHVEDVSPAELARRAAQK